jgi:hypothetical protein
MKMSEYPHKVYASVLLFDNKIVMWKVGSSYWSQPGVVSVKGRLPGHILEGRTVWKEFEVKDNYENNMVFQWHSKQWFKNWEIHEKHAGVPAY